MTDSKPHGPIHHYAQNIITVVQIPDPVYLSATALNADVATKSYAEFANLSNSTFEKDSSIMLVRCEPVSFGSFCVIVRDRFTNPLETEKKPHRRFRIVLPDIYFFFFFFFLFYTRVSFEGIIVGQKS